MDNRVHFLLPKMLALLLMETEIREADCKLLKTVYFATKKDVLNFRNICSTWNKTVENFYERPEMTGLFPNMDVQELASKKPNPNMWANPYVFSSLDPFRAEDFISRFITKKSGTYKNPFLGRQVLFYIDETNGENGAFTKSMMTILEIFGHEIWHVMIYHRQHIAVNNYLKLRNWLQQLPNVLSLRLRFLKCEHTEETLMSQSPLPDLQRLTYLDVCNVNIDVLAMLFIKCQISDFHFDGWTNARQWNINLFKDSFKHLKRVYLHGYCLGYSVLLEIIQKHKNIESLLVHNNDPLFQFGNLFKVFEAQNSLCDLTLKFKANDVNYFNWTRVLDLQIAELSRLTLFIDGNLCIDFVRTLQNLQTLDITLLHSDDTRVDERLRLQKQNYIQFVGFEKIMQLSNIWLILNKLNILRIVCAGKDPMLCYEYRRQKCSSTVLCKTFEHNPLKEAKIMETFENIFRNF